MKVQFHIAVFVGASNCVIVVIRRSRSFLWNYRTRIVGNVVKLTKGVGGGPVGCFQDSGEIYPVVECERVAD